MRLFKNHFKPSPTAGKKTNSAPWRTAVGIDISQYAVKMVQLTGSSLNQIRLEKYAITQLPPDIIKGNKIQDYDLLVTYLQHTYTQLQSNCKIFIAALPHSMATLEHAVYRTDGPGTQNDWETFAEMQATQIGPFEDMNYDYCRIRPNSRSEEQKILIAAGKKDDIEPRAEMFEHALLPLHALDIDLIAQRNAVAHWLNRHAPDLAHEKTAVFGIYDTQMYALVLQSGEILYRQETAIGSEQLNQLVQSHYQTSEEQARYTINAADKPDDYQIQVADRFNLQITQEIRRVLQFYYTTQPSDSQSAIKHILLTGPASQQNGLAELVFAHTNTPAQCVYPALEADKNERIDLARLQTDAPSLTLAFGLALRGL
ncbi:type IV pilus assembly protein PilM [Neisseria animalis]|uniref:Type IV pilus assembly protein PilM n=1 Tax=Neisseria animalis TaxID=492 RepID=A0A5P3MU27_NEIAN|nr:type IV pilus assembly protein PilM [Neisseria animalis]QEY24271.1 type IV pilus assembly protein PilM [Neisseria animalis]ROW32323.1 type IV pilus assembly protein PilM [Neisseria animalis]VEE06663.1 PilM [Neisseria animalis]